MKASNSPVLTLLVLLVAVKVDLSFQEQLFINSNLIEKLIQIEQGGSRKPIVIVPGKLNIIAWQIKIKYFNFHVQIIP